MKVFLHRAKSYIKLLKHKRTLDKYKNNLKKTKNVAFEHDAYTDLKTSFEGDNKLFERTRIYNSSLGYGSYISHDSYLSGVRIGRFCSIGPFVKTLNGSHPTSIFISTHPAFFSTGKQNGVTYVKENKFQEHSTSDETSRICIGNDVWIGGNVTILEGVRIGDGAIVAAGSVITRDIEPYSVVAGIPAKVVKWRFEPDIIEQLKKTKWWEWNRDVIREKAEYFESWDLFRQILMEDNDI